MSMLGGRGGRPDDWESQHARARTRAAERLAAPLDPDEAAWLDDHLGACAECAEIADEYAAQRLHLRALRDRQPVPPRDLWARTAAAIERESQRRSRGSGVLLRRSVLAPTAILAGALVVAVVYGSLTSSQLPIGPATTTPGVAIASTSATPQEPAGPTPLAVAPRDVAYISVEDGDYRVNTTRVDEVCPPETTSCATSEPIQTVEIGPLSSPATVFGSEDRPLVIVGGGGGGGSVVVVDPDQAVPEPTEPPVSNPLSTATPTATPSSSPTSAPAGTPGPAGSPSELPLATPTRSPFASTSPSPAPGGAVEIARNVRVVDTTAAYAPDGSAFAFTAVPADGSHGPDIYLWTVGDEQAHPITIDHRSVFGSWSGDAIVGSTVRLAGDVHEPAAFVLPSGGAERTFLPETGLAWRPVVDPTGGSAVYWSGTLAPTADGPGWTTAAGALVIGRWSERVGRSSDAEPTPPGDDQSKERAETTIAVGPLRDWDVRWDESGERLAVWIADADDSSIGRLSLYVVDPFDGRIDLANPALVDEPALAGFSLADGRLAWAKPAGESGRTSRVRILTWTDDGFGQIESATGDFILIR
ncbi:MAG TPA: hypothetical protein VFO78_07280 [Candidatus Limnocylindrales bacterium]|nr:hypothetical protein [Candidatus Limnocylindrales bacterium]